MLVKQGLETAWLLSRQQRDASAHLAMLSRKAILERISDVSFPSKRGRLKKHFNEFSLIGLQFDLDEELRVMTYETSSIYDFTSQINVCLFFETAESSFRCIIVSVRLSLVGLDHLNRPDLLHGKFELYPLPSNHHHEMHQCQ